MNFAKTQKLEEIASRQFLPAVSKKLIIMMTMFLVNILCSKRLMHTLLENYQNPFKIND